MTKMILKLITASPVKKLFVVMDLPKTKKKNVMIETLKMEMDALITVLLKNAAITE